MELKDRITALAKRYDSFYLYEERRILAHIRQLKAGFPEVDFLYSVKCNSDPNVLACVFSRGLGADAASPGEVKLAEALGLPADRIYYSAPGKTEKDIDGALGHAVLIADSIGEIGRIREAAGKRNLTAEIGIRINPDFTIRGRGGVPSKFGIDEARAEEWLRRECPDNIKVVGIHVHVKSQELNGEALCAYYRNILRLAEKFQHLCGGLDFVNMGSGMGVPYAAADTPLDVEQLGNALEGELGSFRERYPGTKLLMETGRYAVCKSGYYVTKVIDRKVSYGRTYLILKNTLNGFIRPSLARLVMQYTASEEPAGMEPLFTCSNAVEFLSLKDGAPQETVTLAGNLCTAADAVAEDIRLPRLECGDCVIMTNAGSYAAVLSPMQFSCQEKPTELFLTADGSVRDSCGNTI